MKTGVWFMEISLYCHQIAKGVGSLEMLEGGHSLKVALHILRLTIHAIVQTKHGKSDEAERSIVFSDNRRFSFNG
jgi:hypothetical protein